MPRSPSISSAEQLSLFDSPPPMPLLLPDGMRYEPEFLSRQVESQLIAWVQTLPLKEMNYKGYTARRRVVSYGGRYDFEANRLDEAAPIPPELHSLRNAAAAWAGIDSADFAHALVAEYREGTPLGWHRDVPDFEDIVGISLMSDAVIRFRPYPPDAATKADVLKVTVAPRSIYLLRGPARWDWQHSVSPTKALRYSITFRTQRVRG